MKISASQFRPTMIFSLTLALLILFTINKLTTTLKIMSGIKAIQMNAANTTARELKNSHGSPNKNIISSNIPKAYNIPSARGGFSNTVQFFHIYTDYHKHTVLFYKKTSSGLRPVCAINMEQKNLLGLLAARSFIFENTVFKGLFPSGLPLAVLPSDL